MKNFIDNIEGEVEGTPLNRNNIFAIQDYLNESVVFTSNSITKTSGSGDNVEVEVTTFGQNQIIKAFTAGGLTTTMTITFTQNGYIKELS